MVSSDRIWKVSFYCIHHLSSENDVRDSLFVQGEKALVEEFCDFVDTNPTEEELVKYIKEQISNHPKEYSKYRKGFDSYLTSEQRTEMDYEDDYDFPLPEELNAFYFERYEEFYIHIKGWNIGFDVLYAFDCFSKRAELNGKEYHVLWNICDDGYDFTYYLHRMLESDFEFLDPLHIDNENKICELDEDDFYYKHFRKYEKNRHRRPEGTAPLKQMMDCFDLLKKYGYLKEYKVRLIDCPDEYSSGFLKPNGTIDMALLEYDYTSNEELCNQLTEILKNH